MNTKIVSTTLALILGSVSSYAVTVTGVSLFDFSSERGGFQRFAVNTINGSGFDAVAGTHDTANDTGWQTNNDTVASITFDLGAIYDISSFRVWNYNGADNSDAEDVVVNFGETTALGSSLGNYTFALSTGNGYTGEEFSFSTISARYIQFDIKSGYGGFIEGTNNTRVGLAEVRFEAVPEPSSFALIAGMFGLTWIMLRRR